MKRPPESTRFTPEWWADRTMPEPNTGCHLWLGCVCKLGYGRVSIRKRGSEQLVHRLAYIHFVGPIPPGIEVCHRCDVPSCVNPDHLFLGTHTDNMRDMFGKERARPQGRDQWNSREQVRDYIVQNAHLTAAELAIALNVSVGRVYQVAKSEGLEFKRLRRGWREEAA